MATPILRSIYGHYKLKKNLQLYLEKNDPEDIILESISEHLGRLGINLLLLMMDISHASEPALKDMEKLSTLN